MNKPSEINESFEEGKDLETPPKKKLKQARLPFQILSPAVKPTSPPLKSSNKRKLSDTSDDIKVVKIVKPNGTSPHADIKENVCSKVTKSLALGAISSSSPEHTICKKRKDLEGKAADDSNEDIKGRNEKKKNKDTSKADKEKLEKAQSAYEIVLSDSETEAEVNEVAKVEDSISFSSSSKKLDNVVKESVSWMTATASVKVTADVAVSDIPNKILTKQNDIPSDVIEVSEEESSNSINEKEVLNKTLQKEYNGSDIEVLDTEMQEKNNTNVTPEVSDKTSPKESVPSSSVTPRQLKELAFTPKEKGRSKQKNTSKTDSPPGESNNDICAMPKVKKLTPKQLQKQLESAKKREEKERQRQEKEKKKAEEKEEKLRQKQEKEEQRRKEREEKEEQKKKEKEEKEEQKRKEKEEKEEQKRKDREEKEKKKQMEIDQKNEEKRVKDEERRKKEEQRQAEAAAFTSFFVPKKPEAKMEEETIVKSDKTFMPFEVKADMRLAPRCRVTFTSELRKEMDEAMALQLKKELYLDEIKNKIRIPRSSPKTWSLSDFKNDVIILDEEDEMDDAESNIIETHPAIGKLPRPKLLQFFENRRPPYWGTWRKKSKAITPLKPFGKDEKLFDYEVDSDDEWEEEEPGESLHGSDDEKESEDEYEVDNEFFVPHGYLSDEENEEDDQTPEMQKTKLRLLELEFEEEMKQKTERLKPRLIGCIWIDPKTADSAGGQLLKLLSPYTAIYNDGPILTHASELGNGCGSPESQPASPTNSSAKRRKFPEAAIPLLIRLVHGNVNRREFLVKEFLANWSKESQKFNDSVPEDSSFIEDSVPPKPSPSAISKASVSNKIKELATWVACPDEGAMYSRMCWYVPEETRTIYGLSDLAVPNAWVYICKPRKHEATENQSTNPNLPASIENTPKQLITKFTKVMSENERKKQFEIATNSKSPDTMNNTSNTLTSKAPRKLIFPPGVKHHALKDQQQTPEQQQKMTISPVSAAGNHGSLKASNNILTKYIKTHSSKKHSDVKVKQPLEITQFRDDCIVLSD